MPTPLFIILIIALLIAFVWPWIPGSYYESVLIAAPGIFLSMLGIMFYMFLTGENTWGYTLLVTSLAFVFCYPWLYFPWAYNHTHSNKH